MARDLHIAASVRLCLLHQMSGQGWAFLSSNSQSFSALCVTGSVLDPGDAETERLDPELALSILLWTECCDPLHPISTFAC